MKALPLFIAAIVALVGALFVIGCSGEEDNVPQNPQIFPHVNPVNFCEVEMPEPNTPCDNTNPEMACEVGSCGCDGATCTCIPRKLTFDLMLFNRGREKLEISGFEVEHDRRCAFLEPNGGVQLYDNDVTDEFAATARNREAAFMRIQYAPPMDGPGEDEVIVRVHSNAENFAEPDGLEIFVCAAGTRNPEGILSCRIGMDTECNDSTANAFRCNPTMDADNTNPCPSYCSESGTECTPPTPENPMADECPVGEFCRSPYYCVPDADEPTTGTCYCRPCAVPPDEGWDDCPS